MNIIELFDTLNIDKTLVSELSATTIIRIEKQVKVEQKMNPAIETSAVNDLIDALKNYPNEFQFLVNHRNLYNLFSKKTHSSDAFKNEIKVINDEDLKAFIEKYLFDDLLLFFDSSLVQNKYEEMCDILEYKNYFPESLLYKVGRKSISKLEFVIMQITNSNYNAVLFVKESKFFDFLSHFSGPDLDEKMRLLLSKIANVYNNLKNKDFATPVMKVMTNYQTLDEELAEVLARNKNLVSKNKATKEKNKSSDNKFSGKFIFGVIIIILIKIIVVTNKCSSSKTRNIDYDDEIYNDPKSLDEGIDDETTYSAATSIDYEKEIAFLNYLKK